MAISSKNITESCTIPRECRERFLPLQEPYAEPLSSRGVNFSGVSDVVAPYKIWRTNPQFHLVILTLGGEGECVTDGTDKTRLIHPGDLWISPAGICQDYRATGAWRILFFHIDPTHPSGTIPYEKVMIGHATYARQLESAMTWFINESLTNTSFNADQSSEHKHITTHSTVENHYSNQDGSNLTHCKCLSFELRNLPML